MASATKSKDASKSAEQAPDDLWAQIDSRHKPSRAVSRDGMRPVLTNAYIRHEDSGSWLYGTDSYLLIALPIHLDCKDEERAELLPEVGLDLEALTALDKSRTGKFRIRDGLIEVDGFRALFPIAEEVGTPPMFRKLFPKSVGGKVLDRIGFSASLLKRATDCFGAQGDGVALTFHGATKAIHLRPLGAPGEGLLMPVRLAE